jgi:hypothetical protein
MLETCAGMIFFIYQIGIYSEPAQVLNAVKKGRPTPLNIENARFAKKQSLLRLKKCACKYLRD